jgi:ABC-type antimicrobial peptide transport system permease subunit
LKQAGALTAIGLAAGLLLAVGLGRVLASSMLGVVSVDAPTFAGASLALAIVSVAAGCLPARRLLRLDPAAILRGR